jgi:hypothetical protein
MLEWWLSQSVCPTRIQSVTLNASRASLQAYMLNGQHGTLTMIKTSVVLTFRLHVLISEGGSSHIGQAQSAMQCECVNSKDVLISQAIAYRAAIYLHTQHSTHSRQVMLVQGVCKVRNSTSADCAVCTLTA